MYLSIKILENQTPLYFCQLNEFEKNIFDLHVLHWANLDNKLTT